MSRFRLLTSTLGLGAVVVCLAFTLSACDTTFDNPNAAGEEQVLTTVEGLRALAIGMRRVYTVDALSSVVRTSGLTTREFGVVVGFTNPQEIERGGPGLPPENGILTGLWFNNYRVMGMAEQLMANVNVVQDVPTRNAMSAMGHFFKAMTLGNLAQFYPSFPTSVDPAGEGAFRPREEGLTLAVQLLDEGLAILGGTDAPAAFKTRVLGTAQFNLIQSMQAYRARYMLMLGNYGGAIQAADAALANPAQVSVWAYDDGNSNENPLYLQTTQEPATLRPVDNFGIDPATYVVPAADGRKAFFLAENAQIGESSRIPVETMKGFFDTISEPIPVYLPGEMYLIKAEAQARQGNLGAAVTALNQVLTKTNDPFGVNAGLPAYDGPQTAEAILDAIYRNRRIELFLTGVSLEDSRRFNRPAPPTTPSFESYARNRNFYPYPQTERDNNPNTPADPTL